MGKLRSIYAMFDLDQQLMKSEESSGGENDSNCNISLQYFAKQLEFSQLSYILSDSGVVYTNNKLKTTLNYHLSSFNKQPFTGVAQRCGWHSWNNMKPTKIQQQYLSEARDIKFEMQITYFNWISAAFQIEQQFYFGQLEHLFAEVGLANIQPYSTYLDNMKLNEQDYCITYRPNQFSGLITQSTQSGESLNYFRLKKLVNCKSTLLEVVVALSCTDSTFKDTLQSHAIRNQGHSDSDKLEGCVLKANETVQQYMSRSYEYKVKEVKNRKTKDKYFQISLNKDVIIPYQFKVDDWETLIQLAWTLELKWQHQSDFQEYFKQYYDLLEKVRCPCSCRIQSGLPCYHELAIINYLGAKDNKYLLTTLTREEYSQTWLQENVFTYFEAREFYTLNENNQQYNDSLINIHQQSKTFEDKNREEMITYLKQETKYHQYDDAQLITMCEKVKLMNNKHSFKLTTPAKITAGSNKRYKGKIGRKAKD
ncbi:SWIM-type [Hexamita inflata]|uniref:SWIM-type n=1 Tax=Hexamita inflata TaxID=28002 RepID=A0AA86UGM8_9EUKA|nr:SWIM-type [Hexamita inflata]